MAHSVFATYPLVRENHVAKITELKPRPSTAANVADVSARVTEMMYVFEVLDHAVLTTSHYQFASGWKHSSRHWTLDGIEVERKDFEEHLASWLRERMSPRVERTFAPVLPIREYRYSAR